MSGKSSDEMHKGGRRPPELRREIVVYHRRRRAAFAAAALTREVGVRGLTVTGICKEGRMGRDTFYDIFSGVPDCLGFGLDEAFDETFGEALGVDSEGSWLAQVDAMVNTCFAAVTAKPLLAEFCLVHCFGIADRENRRDFATAVAIISSRLSGGRVAAAAELGPAYREPPPLMDNCLASTIVSLAAQKVLQGTSDTLQEHRDEIVLLVANAYFGSAEGARVWREMRAAGGGHSSAPSTSPGLR